MPIYFNNEKARGYLLNMGYVYTARTKRKEEGVTAALRKEKGVQVKFASVHCKMIDESFDSHKAILGKYVEYSGFETVEEWLLAIVRLDKRHRLPRYLQIWRVELI